MFNISVNKSNIQEIIMMAIPNPKWSAIKPIEMASIDVVMVLKKDCADNIEVRSSGGTWSAISPIKSGFLIFSTCIEVEGELWNFPER